ncbi:MAG: hypothetical protein GY757_08775 [bacterium]|nr:hypothetical protein [bacterium]
MKIDIDRLHALFTTKRYDRQSGKTTLLASLLAGQIQLGDITKIVVTVGFARDIYNHMDRIIEVFQSFGIAVERKRMESIQAQFEEKKVKIVFLPIINQWCYNIIRGMDRNTLVYNVIDDLPIPNFYRPVVEFYDFCDKRFLTWRSPLYGWCSWRF